MEKLHSRGEHFLKGPKGHLSASGVTFLCKESWLCHLDIPVAEFIPEEIVYLLYRNAKLIAFHIVLDLFYYIIKL